jgi:YHS domain-containing protein
MRVLLEAVIAILVITLLRAVIGAVLKGFSELFHPSANAGSSGGATPRKDRPIPGAEALKKDPVCGTFIAASSSVQKTIAGETFYFCSPECRDKFREPVRKAG